MSINGTFQNLTATGYVPAGGDGTIAPTITTVLQVNNTPISIGQFRSVNKGPNVAIAKARIVLGTTGPNGNVYSSGNFTPRPDFNPTLPSGATILWSLDSQYPLPTYPSFFDVTQLPQQLVAYGAEPVVVGGVTSNVIGPYPTISSFDSLRFDGTGYIDYGNAATSVMTTNLWANAWTIEAWVYPTAVSGSPTIIQRTAASTYTYDWSFWVNNTNQLSFVSSPSLGGTVTYNTGSVSYPVNLNTWTHVAATSDGARSNVYVGGQLANTMPISAMGQGFNPQIATQIGTGAYGTNFNWIGNLADVRVSNVARYTGTTYTVPPEPHPTNNANTLLLLRSLGGQVGTTLGVQGRGLNAVSLGATRTVRAYPPAPMTSYLLDTTSNASVTYGQGKYVASASSELGGGYVAYYAFDKNITSLWACADNAYNTASPYNYVGSVTTLDILGNSYQGEWIQIQLPVSILLSSYTWYNGSWASAAPRTYYVLGSRDGINWTLVDSRSGLSYAAASQTFTVSATQSYNFFRIVTTNLTGNNRAVVFNELTLNGTEESLCITNDSKVGVGIANPQRALEVAGDVVVGGTLSAGNPLMYRNRVINGDMRIAQRGTSVTTTTSTAIVYLVDRFYVSVPDAAIVSFTTIQNTLSGSDTPYQLGFRNSLRMTTNIGLDPTTYTSAFPRIIQNIDGYNAADFNWGTSFGVPVTLGFWFRTNVSSGSVFNIRITNAAVTYHFITIFTYSGGWQYVTLTIPPPPNGSVWATTTNASMTVCIAEVGTGNGTNITPVINAWTSTANARTSSGCTNWVQAPGNYIELTGVQLEKGTVATPFEFRPYATELALCQTWNNMSSVTGSTSLCLNTAGGNVGIGTTTPAVPIDTVGGTTLNSITNTIAQFRAATTSGTNDAGVVIGSTNGNTPFIGDNASSASLGLSLQTNRTTRIRIDTVGNVGIGTTSPSALLHSIVNTTANIPDAIIGNHVIKSYNRALALAATSFSNICTITTTNGSAVVYLDVVQSETGAASNASYIVPMAYNNTGNAWRLLLAISISNQNAPNYAQVLFKQTNNEATFALYRPALATGGTANFTCTFRISQSQVNTVTFADKTETTTLAAVTTIYSYTQLTQTSTGVGIGTTSPAVALDISTNGGIRVQDPGAYGIITRIISEYNNNALDRWWLLATFSYSSYHIFDVDANLSRIDSAPCDVKFGFAGAYSSSVATQISRSENRGTVGNGYFQAWYNSTTGVIDVWLFATSYTPTMLTMKYYNALSANLTANWTTSAPTTSATYVKQWDTSVNSTYTQLSSSNVGIGTTSPNWTLSTYYAGSNDSATTVKLNFGLQVHNTVASGGNNRPNLILFTDANSTQGAMGAFRRAHSADYTGGLAFYVGSQPAGYTQATPTTTAQASGSLTEAMRIDYRRYVGIGTTSPGRLLDVAGDASINSVRVGLGVGSVGTNTVVGVIAMNNNTTGAKNTAIGYAALSGNTTGGNNTVVGYQALLGNTTGANNTAVGTQALLGNTTGANNTAVGQLAGYNITTGSRNVVIGSDGAASTATISNEVTITNGINFCRFQGSGTTWLFTSDARDKTNISDIPVGIDFINNLRPVSYQWDRRDWYDDKQSDGSKTEPIASLGFIAQEVDEAVQMSGHADVLSRLIYKNDPENLMLSETGIIPILVKAVQELSAQVKDLQTEVALLKSGA
jgi:hypothetical protein